MSNETAYLGEQTVRKVTRRIIPFIFLLFIIAYLDRVNLSYAALDMNKDLALTSEIFGLAAGIFFLGYVIFEIPSNIALHKFGARKWIARILISWGAVVVLTGFVQNATHLYILRFLLGIAEAGFFPGIILYITYWFRSKDQAKAYAMFYLALPVSNILGAPVSALIMDNINAFGWEGWRWMFILEGLPAILLGSVTFYYLTDRPEQASWLSEKEKSWLKTELENERSLKQPKGKHSIGKVFTDVKILHLSLIYITINFGLYGIGFWMPQIIKGLSQDLSTTQIGFLTMIPYIFAGVTMTFWGMHSDKTGERKWHAALPPIVGAAGLLGCAIVKDPAVSLVFLSLTTMGLFSFFAPFWSIPNRFLAGTSAAVGLALINSIGNFGGFLGPYVMGYTSNLTGSTSSGLFILSGALILCACLVLLFKMDRLTQDSKSSSSKNVGA
ncbi:MFS transporter [Bacillus sp. T33-2]|uniref:MFS transporter n=1 Tax=Bacillus sp. T33-2 TaxID=2054168 RepID=UPI000C758876|nr:MFS transporter [Bacillus sp. T33-2]PLR95910.1 MFS transporter [Bacillus sp. T33-2]